MNRSIILLLLFITASQLQSQEIPISVKNFDPVNVTTEETMYKSKKGLRVTEKIPNRETIAIAKGITFENGTIEVEVAGKPLPNANPGARGFIGIAFRVINNDTLRYDCFYLRPSNGRADDQIRRNHSTQYIAHPAYPWYRLRKEFPELYESYVDLAEGEWTKIKIVVKGKQAKLYVHDADQPALIVNALLHSESIGGVALWVGQGTDGYFRNLRITNQ
ncbi:MAG: hypothetical protein HYV29_15765 [Ignavibacteriales bacterium]|nr:hypothetical protein [Ignavibacteriales bacterium]